MLGNLSIAFVLLGATVPVLSQASADNAPGPVSVFADLHQAQSDQVSQYWTTERMQSAQPVPIPQPIVPDKSWKANTQEVEQPPGPPILIPGRPPKEDDLAPLTEESNEYILDLQASDILPLTYGTAPTNPKDGPYGPFQRWTMQGRYDVWPRFIHGVLFFSRGGLNYRCSATVIGRSVIATAGHCVSDGAGTFSSNFLFCPGYSQTGEMAGAGCWGYRGVATTGPWHNSGDWDYDYACIVTSITGSQYAGQVGDKTGMAGSAYNFSSNQPIVEFGYPAQSPFTGTTIQQVVSTEWYEVDMVAGGQPSKYIGSDLTPGSSGGGWFVSWRHPTTEFPDTDNSWATDPVGAQNGPFLNGVNSHYRCRVNCDRPPSTTAGIFWQEMGSPVFRWSDSDINDAHDIFELCLTNQ